jgi:hypothetical protein
MSSRLARRFGVPSDSRGPDCPPLPEPAAEDRPVAHRTAPDRVPYARRRGYRIGRATPPGRNYRTSRERPWADLEPIVHDGHQTARLRRTTHLAHGHADNRRGLGQRRAGAEHGDDPHDLSVFGRQRGETVFGGGLDTPLGEQGATAEIPAGHPNRQPGVGGGGGQAVGAEVRRNPIGVERRQADANAFSGEFADCGRRDRSGRIVGGDDHDGHRDDAVDEETEQLDGCRTGVM